MIPPDTLIMPARSPRAVVNSAGRRYGQASWASKADGCVDPEQASVPSTADLVSQHMLLEGLRSVELIEFAHDGQNALDRVVRPFV